MTSPFLSVQAPAPDPTGFGVMLNALRSNNSKAELRYDPGLSRWARWNNAACVLRGLGHWLNPGGAQCAGWNQTSAKQVYSDWYNSPGHLAAMLSPAAAYGIAQGPGPYWTLNLK